MVNLFINNRKYRGYIHEISTILRQEMVTSV